MSVKRDFSGKVVIITGSSSGIGAVTAEEFARTGAQVVITGRNVDKLSEVAKKCLNVSPNALKPLEIVADVSIEEDCQRLIDSTIEKFGQLDILVNNSGKGALSTIEDENILDVFDELFNTNVRAVVHLTNLSIKYLKKTKGNIINISSVAGLRPLANYEIYAMTKSALDMFTKSAALELGSKGIRINGVNPAAVRTNFGPAMGVDQATYDGFLDQRAKSYPLGRVGEPKDITNAILFLASDECSWITGTNILADGGGIYAPIGSSAPPQN